MPRASIAEGEYYHIFNRGVNKQPIFNEAADYMRMLFLILHFQSQTPLYNLERYVRGFAKHGKFNLSGNTRDRILNEQKIELISFCLMPNHFHLMLLEKTEGGISYCLQRIENAYTKYFNTKYKRFGYLLQGAFQSVHVETNEQALYLSAYIHKNPCELSKWRKKFHSYPWSSYQDYLETNRWDKLLKPNLILEQFDSSGEYKDFVETSGAKEIADFLDVKHREV